VVKAADGSDVPSALLNYTYIVVQANTTTTLNDVRQQERPDNLRV
jgi:hypothetical protein